MLWLCCEVIPRGYATCYAVRSHTCMSRFLRSLKITSSAISRPFSKLVCKYTTREVQCWSASTQPEKYKASLPDWQHAASRHHRTVGGHPNTCTHPPASAAASPSTRLCSHAAALSEAAPPSHEACTASVSVNVGVCMKEAVNSKGRYVRV